MSDLTPAALIPSINGLPGPGSLQAALLYLTFAFHLILMNVVTGVCVIILFSRLRGFRQRARSGRREADAAVLTPEQYGNYGAGPSLLLPKVLALVVNFGIAPLLFMQALYPQFIYTSFVLSALWWLSVMGVVLMAYYGLYINMNRSGLGLAARTSVLAIATLLLLGNAFLFVNNITLLQNPEHWTVYASSSGGNFLNMADPQVPPRYLHVLLASLAVGGLALAVPAELRLGAASVKRNALEEQRLEKRKKLGLTWFFYATLAQAAAGTWFLLSLPPLQRSLFLGERPLHTGMLALAILTAVGALAAARQRRAVKAALLAGTTLFLMVGLRSLLRISFLEPYHHPALRAVEAGPLLFFGGSLLISIPVLWKIAGIYFRSQGATALTAVAASPEDPEEAVILVNELAVPVSRAAERTETEAALAGRATRPTE